MFLRCLNWLFRISGQAPANRRSDKCFAAVVCCLILVTGRQSVILSGYRFADTTHSVTLHIGATCAFFNWFGALINANVREVNFVSISNRIASSYELEWREIYCSMSLYAIEFGMRLVQFLTGRQNIAVTLMRIFNFNFFNVPLFQLMLLIRRLQKRFGCLNNELKTASSSNSSTSGAPSCDQVSLIFKDHVDLRNTLKDVNSYFSVYILLNLATRVMITTGSLHGILKAVQNGETQVEHAVLVVNCVRVLMLWWILYFCEQLELEANKTVHLAHEMITPNSSMELLELVEQFSLTHVDNPASLSVAGIFPLNMSLLTKVVGFSLTYFIVLLQFNAT